MQDNDGESKEQAIHAAFVAISESDVNAASISPNAIQWKKAIDAEFNQSLIPTTLASSTLDSSFPAFCSFSLT